MSLVPTDSGSVPPADSDPRASQPTMAPEPSTAPAAEPPAADPGPAPEPSSPPQPKPGPKLCGVCGTQQAKYKCPRCSLPYCSVPCSKSHKENHPPDPPKPSPAPAASTTATDTTDTASSREDQDPFSILLEHRAAFQRLFEKYPSLPAELARIQQTTLPPSENSTASSCKGLPIPGLGQDHHRNHPFYKKNRGSQEQNQPWTRDVGLRRGADALRRARTDPGDVGDGVREFCELVLYLLSEKAKQQTQQPVEGGRGGGDDGVMAKVREGLMAEETRVIERLLREEGG